MEADVYVGSVVGRTFECGKWLLAQDPRKTESLGEKRMRRKCLWSLLCVRIVRDSWENFN